MASTFSPNLRIELIGAGEQAGTWGTTTNTNLGTLVEDAISGYTAVTISSAAQALTANNGAADEARNAIIQLNSAAAAFAVYAPPESKQYTVFNNTSYTATIYNSTALGNTTAAGAGVAIPAGKTMTVWSDGTNFKSQLTNIPSDVLGSGTADSSTFLRGDRQWSTISIPDPIPSGTAMMFVQTAAPTGWTKSTTHDNKALRVVSGTASSGGSAAFTTAFGTPSVSGSVSVSGTVGSTTLTTAQMPSHSHSVTIPSGGSSVAGQALYTNGSGSLTFGTTSQGGGDSHDHSFSGSGSLSSATATINVAYVDVIIATKD